MARGGDGGSGFDWQTAAPSNAGFFCILLRGEPLGPVEHRLQRIRTPVPFAGNRPLLVTENTTHPNLRLPHALAPPPRESRQTPTPPGPPDRMSPEHQLPRP